MKNCRQPSEGGNFNKFTQDLEVKWRDIVLFYLIFIFFFKVKLSLPCCIVNNAIERFNRKKNENKTFEFGKTNKYKT